jgi:BioD-like phosphotransacetylase family protein
MRRVRRVIMGAMSARRSAEYLNKPGTLLIVSGDREKLLAAMAVAESARALSGILFSNGLLPPEPVTQALIAQGIALMAVETEAFAVTARINNMTVKTTAQDEDKIPLIRELVANHVDLKAILAAIKT